MSRSRIRTGATAFVVLTVAVGVLARSTDEAGRSSTERRPEAESVREGGESEANEAKYESGRADSFIGPRRYPYKSVPQGALERSRAQAASLRVRGQGASADAVGLSSWTAIGPHPIASSGSDFYNGRAPYSGRVSSIAPDPANANVAYLAGAAGGIWKTTDGGTNWTPTFDAQPALTMGAVAVDPANAATVYAGTGEADTSDYLGVGLYKSTNGGTSWLKVGGTTFDGCMFSDIVVKPNDSNVVVVSVHDGFSSHNDGASNRCTGARAGVYRSTDGGATWSLRLNIGRPSDLATDNTTPNNFWVATDFGDGIFKSTDGGQSFDPVGGLPGYGGRAEIATAPSDGDRVYAILATGSGALSSIQTSSNSGASWSALPNAGTLCSYTTGAASGQCFYDLTMTVDPIDPAIFYAAGIYPYKFTNFGASNARIAPDGAGTLIHVDFHALAFTGDNLHSTSRRLWIGSDGGAYRTDDQGATFTNLNNDLELTQFEPGISGKGTAASPLIAGTQDNGTLRYVGSPGWTEPDVGDGGFTAIDATNPQVLYDTYVFLAISKSVNGGLNFNNLDAQSTICPGNQCRFYSPIIGHPVQANTVYAGSRNLWRTTNGGTNWSKTGVGAALPSFISAIGVANDSIDKAYVGLETGGIRATTNFGDSYVVGSGLPNRFVSDIVVNPANSNEAYATVSGFGTAHVFRTTNGGSSWSSVNGNLVDSPASAIAIDWRTAPPSLYTGTDVGVFVSNDGGTNWSDVSTGMPHSPLMDLALDPGSNLLTAVTHGRGAFQSTVGPTTVANDDFANAQALAGAAGTANGSNVGATKQTGEPSANGNAGGKSIWYSFTPSANGTLTIDTCTSSFDTTLGVYTGGAVTTLLTVVSDDDSCGPQQSRVSFAASAGSRYAIQVDGFNGASGAVALHWSLTLGNDNFESAQVLTGFNGTISTDNSLGTRQAGEPKILGNDGGHSIWYSFTPSASATLFLDTCGSGFDTLLGVYTGTALNALTGVGANDDGCGSVQSRVNLPVTAGTRYSIQIDGFNGVAGNVLLHYTLGRSFAIPWSTADANRLRQVATYLELTPEDLQRQSVAFLALLVVLSGDPTPTPWTPPPLGNNETISAYWPQVDLPLLTAVKEKYVVNDINAHRLGVYFVGFLVSLGGH